MKLLDVFKRNIFYIVMITMIGWIVILHQAVFMHFDDFGYGSLTYNYSLGQPGTDWTISELYDFLKYHYLNWGGRVLFYGILCLACKEQLFIQYLQSFIFIGIILFTYILVRREKRDFTRLVIVYAFFMSVGAYTASDGVYWYSASAGYVWPFFFLFLGMICLIGDKSIMQFLSPIFWFMAGFSYEQIAVAVFIFCVLNIFVEHYYDKTDIKHFISYISGMTGSIIELTAPGNFARADSNEEFMSLSLLKKIQSTLPYILEINFGSDCLYRILIYSFILLLLGSYWISKIKWLLPCNIISIVAVLAFTNTNTLGTNTIVIRFMFVVLLIFETSMYLWEKRELFWLILFWGGVASQGMLLISPVVLHRSSISFVFISNVVFMRIMNAEIEDVSGIYLKKYLLNAIIIVCILNAMYITNGYYKNYAINIMNRKELECISQQMTQGDSCEYIQLKKLNDDKFSTCMPYQDGYEFIENGIKAYYEIPYETKIVWN